MAVGIVRETLSLKNAALPHFIVLKTRARVDTASTHLCIPESIRAQLDLEVVDVKPMTLADGSETLVPYVGPVEVRFRERFTFCGALVTGDEVLLGMVPLEGMNLIVAPTTQTLEYNPRPVRA
jgi:clan AA aspartic protease